MPPLPRGKCPVCGGDVALRRGGLVREHFFVDPKIGRQKCPGSGKAVAEVLTDDWPYDGDPPDPI